MDTALDPAAERYVQEGQCYQQTSPAHDMRTLRRTLKTVDIGTGAIAKAIESSTFQLTERGFTMLIVSCRRCGRWRKALEIFETMKGEEMKARGVRPNFYTYSSLISVCCASGACSQALATLHEMRAAGKENKDLTPDAEVYDILIGACHRRQRYVDVVDVYRLLRKEEHLSVSKKVQICTMEACAEMHLWETVFELLGVLGALGADVPTGSYAHLLSCAVEQGEFTHAVEVFLTMQVLGVVPDQMACYHMVKASAGMSDLVTCLDLIKSMHDAGMVLSSATYGCVLALLEHSKLCNVGANTSTAKCVVGGKAVPDELWPVVKSIWKHASISSA